MLHSQFTHNPKLYEDSAEVLPFSSVNLYDRNKTLIEDLNEEFTIHNLISSKQTNQGSTYLDNDGKTETFASLNLDQFLFDYPNQFQFDDFHSIDSFLIQDPSCPSNFVENVTQDIHNSISGTSSDTTDVQLAHELSSPISNESSQTLQEEAHDLSPNQNKQNQYQISGTNKRNTKTIHKKSCKKWISDDSNESTQSEDEDSKVPQASQVYIKRGIFRKNKKFWGKVLINNCGLTEFTDKFHSLLDNVDEKLKKEILDKISRLKACRARKHSLSKKKRGRKAKTVEYSPLLGDPCYMYSEEAKNLYLKDQVCAFLLLAAQSYITEELPKTSNFQKTFSIPTLKEFCDQAKASIKEENLKNFLQDVNGHN